MTCRRWLTRYCRGRERPPVARRRERRHASLSICGSNRARGRSRCGSYSQRQGWRDRPAARHPLSAWLSCIDGPARVAVLLSELRWLVLPVLGNATVTERLLVLLCVALLRRRADRGIENLAPQRQETRSRQKLVEAPEQDVDSTGSLQSLTKCPDRIGIGNRIRHADAQKTHER